MQIVIAAAIFSRSNAGRVLMKALLLYLIEENKLLGQDRAGDDTTILNRVIPYARASFVSSIFQAEKRLEACTMMGGSHRKW